VSHPSAYAIGNFIIHGHGLLAQPPPDREVRDSGRALEECPLVCVQLSDAVVVALIGVVVALVTALGVVVAALIAGLATVVAAWLQSRR
jgi:hypothetical protein